MSAQAINPSDRTGEDHRQLAAGTHDFMALFGTCARRIVPMAAGSFTMLKNSGGDNYPILSFPDGFVHDSDTSAITTTVVIVAYK